MATLLTQMLPLPVRKPIEVRIKSKTPLSGQHPAMLVCSIYDFFPNKIKVRWLRDEQEVTSDVTSTEVMPNGDWYYQTHSYLEYTPRSGENISCVVEHVSLNHSIILLLHSDMIDASYPCIGGLDSLSI
uniref:Ig-like domain-containing protein n=1 Tax=Oreochromis aureus TaxID=47969 RepID=A0A668VSB5_OREAU